MREAGALSSADAGVVEDWELWVERWRYMTFIHAMVVGLNLDPNPSVD